MGFNLFLQGFLINV